MWRNFAKQASSRKIRISSESCSCLSAASTSSKISQRCKLLEEIKPSETQTWANSSFSAAGFRRMSLLSPQSSKLGILNFVQCNSAFGISGSINKVNGYASVAEAIVSTDPEEDFTGSEEVQEEISKEEKNKMESYLKQPKKMVAGMGIAKYNVLKKRQIKMETEAWEEAAKEYQELLEDMCEQKLAPNLPYMKSLFLGWFEPLRDAIAAEQESIKDKKVKPPHAPYFEQLPSDMMAVITMHKLMGLLMTNTGGIGSVRVVQAACQIGEAIEHEARIHKFLDKTKKKMATQKKLEGESEPVNSDQGKMIKEQERLRKKVTQLMKKQKVQQVREIVKGHDDSKPWGQEVHVKVGCYLIKLLTETAYIQPPVDQLGGDPPDIRPAFVHTLKTVTKEAQKGSRRYGVIECDPLVLKGLEKTARHMVIPYMPMLVPPLSWTG
ncbi:DNA-directed RNA polymerase 1B, mitochondrial-like, partial [Carica papaya]|uniref:DNA-directed RNA polymerase 1B, mitochondrial-like n=1 Tax=Carica papaya TaxID=3649 RepID=UPI000B8CDDFE